MNIEKRSFIAAIFIALLAAPAVADFEDCPASDIITVCLTQQVNSALTKAHADAKEAVDEAPKKLDQGVLEGVSSATNTGAAAALVDLLPDFLASFGLDGTTDDDGNYTFEKPILFGENSPVRLSIGATAFLKPKLFGPLAQALDEELPEEVRQERKDELEGRLEELDNFDLRLRLSLERGTGHRLWGRDYRDYSDLFVDLFREIVDEVDPLTRGTTALKAFSEDVSKIDPDLASATVGQIRALEDTDEQDRVIAAFNAALKEQVGVVDALGTMRSRGYDKLADLIGNQPQLLVTGLYRQRNDVSGPDERSLSLTYEVGLGGNVNDMLSWAIRHQTDGCKVTEVAYQERLTYPCVTRYLEAKPKAAEKGQRFAISVEYSDIDAFELSLPNDDFDFSLDASQKLIGSLTYDRELSGVQLQSPGEGGEESARFALEAKYEDVSDDPMRQSRFVGTATLSQKLTACTVFSVSAVYADRPEFRGDVDEEVSARFGFRWGEKQLDACKKK